MSDASKVARRCAQRLVLGSSIFLASTAALGASAATSTSFGITGTDVLGITGTDVLGITGTDVLGITGTDVLGITGTDVLGITGTDVLGITGTDVLGITGTDVLGITGTDVLGITGTDVFGITGTDVMGITGTDVVGITGTDLLGITGTDLLVVGVATAIDADILSVLGQTVWIGPGLVAQDFVGKPVAVFGQIDMDSGSFVNTSVIALGGADMAGSYPSYLRGMVDAVDPMLGMAVVSGISVDYTALLANGVVPSVGSEVAVSGYAFGGQTTLVADPSVKFNIGL